MALKSGRMLAHRIHALKHKNPQFSSFKTHYDFIPTTVFSPTEYSVCGLSEEEAETTFSKEEIEIYHTRFTPLEQWMNSNMNDDFEYLRQKAYIKLICKKDS